MKRLAPLALAVALACSQMVTADAASGKPKWSPQILRIGTALTANRTASITVSARATSSDVGRVKYLVISANGKTCRAAIRTSGGVGTCTVSRLKRNKVYKVRVRSVNQSGKGRWTGSVKTTTNGKSRLYYLAQGKQSVDHSHSEILNADATAVTGITMFAAPPTAGAVRRSATITANLVITDPNQVLVDVSDALALAQPVENYSSATFYKITGTGQTVDPVVNGSLDVQRYYIAPDDSVYLYPAFPPPGTPYCALLRVTRSNPEPTCQDPTLVELEVGFGHAENPDLQYDASGAVYYRGREASDGPVKLKRVLPNGTVDTLAVGDIQRFLVLTSGDVLYTQCLDQFESTGLCSVNRLTPGSAPVTLLTNTQATFIRPMADGRVWLGLVHWSSPTKTPARYVRPYNPSTGAFAAHAAWGYAHDRVVPLDMDLEFDPMSPCNGDAVGDDKWGKYYGFCSNVGTDFTDQFDFPDSGETWVISGRGGKGDSTVAAGANLMRFAPSLAASDLSIWSVTHATAVGDFIAVSGTSRPDALTSETTFLTSIFDPATGDEVNIFNGDNQIEIYDLAYQASTNELLFGGRRISDGKYVIGRLPLAWLSN